MKSEVTDEPVAFTVISLGFAALVFLAVLVVVCLPYFYSKPIKTIKITKGSAGAFIIGETKEEVLAKLPKQSFSPDPKPSECSKTWIEVSEMTEVQRACLLKADTWHEGIASARALCPGKVDIESILSFQSNKLVRLTVICRRPK